MSLLRTPLVTHGSDCEPLGAGDREVDPVAEMCRKAREWLESPEGREAMAESLKQAEETSRQFREACRVDWRTLHEPMTL